MVTGAIGRFVRPCRVPENRPADGGHGPSGGAGLVLGSLARQWRVALLVAIPFLLGVTFYAESLAPQYDATAVATFAPRAERNPSADVVRLVLPKYAVYVTSNATAERVGRLLGRRPEDVDRGLNATIATDTANLTITSRQSSAADAAAVANALAREAVLFSADDPLLQASVLTPALPPGAPSAPARRLLEGAGALVGVVLASIAAVTMDRARPRIRSVADVGHYGGLPVLAQLPALRRGSRDWLDGALSSVPGAYLRPLVSRLAQAAEDRSGFTLLVTSTRRAEGRTTVATLLVGELARRGTPVLLVDAEVAQPSVAEAAGVPSEPGIAEVLLDGLPLNAAVTMTEPGVAVLANAGSRSIEEALISSGAQLLDKARAEYNAVVVDGPALQTGEVARSLALAVDAVLVVVGTSTPALFLRAAVGDLLAMDVEPWGSVANRVETAEAG